MGEKIILREIGVNERENLVTELARSLEEKYSLADFDARQYSPLTLAYIGDCIYELIIRTLLVRGSNAPVNKLHRTASSLVKAETQSEMIGVFEERDLLTEDEKRVFHRGRNAKAYTHAKNASIQEYRRATGFEAVCGYLYLKGDVGRLVELVSTGLSAHYRKLGEPAFVTAGENADPDNHTGQKQSERAEEC